MFGVCGAVLRGRAQDDFEQFLWTVVFIAMGGIALGNGVTNSGLLEVLGEGIRELISGMDLYPVVLLLSVIVLVRPFLRRVPATVLFIKRARFPSGNRSSRHSSATRSRACSSSRSPRRSARTCPAATARTSSSSSPASSAPPAWACLSLASRIKLRTC